MFPCSFTLSLYPTAYLDGDHLVYSGERREVHQDDRRRGDHGERAVAGEAVESL